MPYYVYHTTTLGFTQFYAVPYDENPTESIFKTEPELVNGGFKSGITITITIKPIHKIGHYH
jgi:hypothetical protein